MSRRYFQKAPTQRLASLIKSFWQIDQQQDVTIRQEKIIPDGYPELIFHYGDAYKINISGNWQIQAPDLIAGQISKYFYLQNTGLSKMFAIKFQPWALYELFDLDMSGLTDKVISIPAKLHDKLKALKTVAVSPLSFVEKLPAIEKWFLEIPGISNRSLDTGQKAVELIIKHQGRLSLNEIQGKVGISERTMERYFKIHIGLSPKFYTRIVRFSNIFKLVQLGNLDWGNVVFLSGFYDQAHFIKNFKEFTGEDPSKYKFFEENMANLFLKG